MKKAVIVAGIILAMSTSNAWALLDEINDNSTNQTQGQQQGQLQGQGQGQQQGQIANGGNSNQHQNATAFQGQGQSADNQGVSTQVSFDQENENLVLAPPSMSVSGQLGQSGAGVSTPFGGFNWIDDAEHTQMKERFEMITAMFKAQIITQEEASNYYHEAFLRFLDATEPRRWFGVGPVARGFNPLAWNSRDRVAEVQAKSDRQLEQLKQE